MSGRDFTYRGVDHFGKECAGILHHNSAADLARHLYNNRWQWADITVDGRTVGAVTRDLHGNRTWWGEKAGFEPKPAKPARRRARAPFHVGELR
jgi:hypothetical protein